MTHPATDRRATGSGQPLAVLIVDDCDAVRRALVRLAIQRGFVAREAEDAKGACLVLDEQHVDVVLSDVHMPGMDGIALLKIVRERDSELPVILLTGRPDVASAMEAVRLGAHQYFTKPFERAELVEAIERAGRLYRLSQIQREALSLRGIAWQPTDPAGLEAAFDRCLEGLWMAYQPIVRAQDGIVFGYEALMRSREPSLPHPGAVLDAAERLGELESLGRLTRKLSPRPMDQQSDAALFVNLHPRDVMDDALLDPDTPLAQMASRVVLEVTERQLLEDAKAVADRVEKLRAFGFRIAVDDLGAGYASLNAFATLNPDFVKLDIGLVRDVDSSELKARLIASIIRVCREMGMTVVAEGVETVAERDTLVELGCDLLQGFLFAKPAEAFPTPVWPDPSSQPTLRSA